MQVSESLLLSRYIKTLQLNKISDEKIGVLKHEFIQYVEGEKPETLSNELNQFLIFINDEEIEKQKVKEKRM